MRLFCSGLVLFLSAYAAAAAEPSYLRCVGADTLNRQDGKFSFVTIDLKGRRIRVDDNYAQGTTTSVYSITGDEGEVVVGSKMSKTHKGQDVVKIDRLSGRMTIFFDVTDSADKLWNEQKNRVGGFDLRPGEPLYATVAFDCTLSRPVF